MRSRQQRTPKAGIQQLLDIMWAREVLMNGRKVDVSVKNPRSSGGIVIIDANEESVAAGLD
jgi:hypothetical protein